MRAGLESLRACFKNIPGGLSTFAAKSSEFESAAEASADKPAGLGVWRRCFSVTDF